MEVPHLRYDPQSSFLQWGYFDQLYDHILELIIALPDRPDLSELSVLDIGCGRGEILKKLANRGINCVGLDLDPVCVKRSSQYAHCVQGDAAHAADYFRENSFDVVIASHILEHLPSPISAIEQMKLVSKRWLILAVPNLSSVDSLGGEWYKYWKNKLHVNPNHVYGWNRSHFIVFLEKHCGLNIFKMPSDIVLFPLPKPVYEVAYPLLEPLLKILTYPFPTFGSSLLVLCEIANTGNHANK